jgi:sporadic carbohydrate cluster protein (TIGR04323 family)
MSSVSAPLGFRGYMVARTVMGRSVPQNVQQLVMRDYCAARGMSYLLAATEYCMAGSTMMLDGLLAGLERLDGIVAYSLFSLPERREDRRRVYARTIQLGRSLHLAAERLAVRNWDDARRLEDTWLVKDVFEARRPDDFLRLAEWDLAHGGS